MYYNFIIIPLVENLWHLLKQHTLFDFVNLSSVRWICEWEAYLLLRSLTELLQWDLLETFYALYSTEMREFITACLYSIIAIQDRERFEDWVWIRNACKRSIASPRPERKHLLAHSLCVSCVHNWSGVFKRAC